MSLFIMTGTVTPKQEEEIPKSFKGFYRNLDQQLVCVCVCVFWYSLKLCLLTESDKPPSLSIVNTIHIQHLSQLSQVII